MRGVWVGAAGFVGAVARYHVEGLVSRRAGGAFPWGTLAVNLTGCLLLGALFTLFTARFVNHADLRIALTVGFVGSYTTFSTFALETVRLGQEGDVALAFAYVAASVVTGVVAVWTGMALARVLWA